MPKLRRPARLLLALCLVLLGGPGDARPSSAQDRPFTFAVFGDNRPESPGDPLPSVFHTIIDQVNKLKPSFALNTGDIVYGSRDPREIEQQFMEYSRVVRRLTMPVHVSVGNHEIGGNRDNEAMMKRLLKRSSLYYSFTFGNSYFAVLNTEIVGETSKITGAQLEWLKADLKRNRAKAHKFVFIHRPLYPVDGHIGSSLDQYPDDRAKFVAVLKQNKVDAVFAGHEHLFDKSVVDGVTEYITGGAGAPLYPSYKLTGMYPHFLLVRVNGKYVSVKVVRIAAMSNK